MDTITGTQTGLCGRDGGGGRGKLHVVGIGPGGKLDRTHRAEAAIAAASVVVGYTGYLRLITDLTVGKELVATGMMGEVARCREALRRAAAGEVVALVSSGDPGVYGMAGLALEMAAAERFDVPIEIVPGLTAACSAAARLGAPLMLDFAVVSLSDLLVPWETIRRRLQALAAADLVTVLYNPRSVKRVHQLEEAVALFRASRPDCTPVGIARAVGREDESIRLTTLGELLRQEVDMFCVLVIGNSATAVLDTWLVTRRGYQLGE